MLSETQEPCTFWQFLSGLHVGLILQLLLFTFGKFPRVISKYQALMLALSILIFYAFMTGGSAWYVDPSGCSGC